MNKNIEKIVLTGLYIAIGVILPQLFHSINLGNVISPMHFPVLLCGIMVGWKYGLAAGIITPLLCSFMFSKPPINYALSMAIELGVYGLISGLLYDKLNLINNKVKKLYLALIIAMLAGRMVSSLTNTFMYMAGISNANLKEYLIILFYTGLPGIILQILIIPPIALRINLTLNSKELN
jgi:uncharacterized membrane protein